MLASQINGSMPSQRVILGSGLAILLMIIAVSIGLDVKSRSDTAWVNHTFEVLNKISDISLLVRRAESAGRGYALAGTERLDQEFNAAREQIAPAFAELTTRRIFLEAPAVAAALGTNPAASSQFAPATPVLTYLVNCLSAGDRHARPQFGKAARYP